MHSHKALVVDDDRATLKFMKQVLELRHYSVQTFDNPTLVPPFRCGSCPCSLRDTGCPDIIISDFNMPVMKGDELLTSRIDKGCRCRHLALITGTQLSEPELLKLADYGIRYFKKPLELSEFFTWLNQIEAVSADFRRDRLTAALPPQIKFTPPIVFTFSGAT